MAHTSQPVCRPRLLVVCRYFPALSETFVVDHIIGMIRRGWDVVVVANLTNEAEASKLRAQHGVRFKLIKLPDWSVATGAQRLVLCSRALLLIIRKIPSHILNRAAWRCAMSALPLRDTIEAYSPAVIHAHFGHIGVTAALATDLPLLVNFHGHDFTSWTKRWGWRLYREALRDATVIAHSDFAEKRLASFGVTNVRRVTMGVDLDRFAPSQREDTWPRPLRLLSVGRLIPQKGHDVALRAMAILRKHKPSLDVRLRIVGAGPEEFKLGTFASKLLLDGYVEGPVAMASSEMQSVYNAADVLIAASQSTNDGWEEGFCRTAVEGMACGLPVVATPCGGLPDTVGPGGIIATAQDAEAVAAAVQQLMEFGSPTYWARRALESAHRFGISQMHLEYQQCTGVKL